ncbi:MAG TPA: glutamine--tRNA ligase/YqeY domain fusion protein [Xanthobacteraceae bacterium]|jgi:glutaminyl-tRNA synthetase|nr:glutamine--tRNA ligase/YqeY domain fusion protein [Xanthobacteraceae bacterium]
MTAAEAISETGRDFIRDIVAADREARRYPKIVTRFPPEPNGYLHIGHAKSICLNFGIAQEFGGQCNLRFDDTNPTKEEQEYIDAIKADVHWLGFDWGDNLHYASDYFEQLYAWAEHLIRDGLAYVDDQSQDEMRANRGTLTAPGRNSRFRDRTVAENLDLFRRMRAGEFPNGARVLRAKIDMASGNINLRDPVLYRILHAHHPRTGTAWCIYPSYDFAHGQSDAIEGVTHSICTLEFEDHRPLYDWFLEHLPVPSRPHQYEFARLNLSYTVLSKRVLTELVRGGHVTGWDDPRMPTLAGLRRRGVPPEALREFVRRIGVAKANSVVDVAMLEHAIREVLNTVALRRMAVLRPLKVVIENYPEGQGEELEAVNHPDNPAAAKRRVRFGRELYVERDDFMENPSKKFFRLSPGKEVRLRYAYFITCREVVKDAAGEVVALRCTYDPATRGGNAPDGRKVRATLHWVSAADAVTAEVRLYNELFTKPDPDVGNFAADINPNSLEVLRDAKVEPVAASDNSPAPVQFERLGYFARDRASAPGRPVFNRTVGLRDTWGKVQGADTGTRRVPMSKVTKLEAGKRQLDAAIRMFFDDEDFLAIHTLSRAAFRVLFDITAEGETKAALDAHMKKIGRDKFNKITNFLKHAERDPDSEIDEDFYLSTEAGLGMGSSLYFHHAKELTPEMKAFGLWSRLMRPKYFDLPQQLAKDIADFRAENPINPDDIKTRAASRALGKVILKFCRARMAK